MPKNKRIICNFKTFSKLFVRKQIKTVLFRKMNYPDFHARFHGIAVWTAPWTYK